MCSTMLVLVICAWFLEVACSDLSRTQTESWPFVVGLLDGIFNVLDTTQAVIGLCELISAELKLSPGHLECGY